LENLEKSADSGLQQSFSLWDQSWIQGETAEIVQ
jgi:hypothetical protein